MNLLPITKENARELGKRGADKRTANLKILQAQAALVPELQRQIANLRLSGQPDGDYIGITLKRVRERIEKILDQMENERDPQELQRLATALDKLADIEQKLAGRPLPGSLRPTKQAKARSSVIADPIE